MKATVDLDLSDDKYARVEFGGGLPTTYLAFRDKEFSYPEFEYNLSNTELDSLIEILSMARDAKKENA